MVHVGEHLVVGERLVGVTALSHPLQLDVGCWLCNYAHKAHDVASNVLASNAIVLRPTDTMLIYELVYPQRCSSLIHYTRSSAFHSCMRRYSEKKHLRHTPLIAHIKQKQQNTIVNDTVYSVR
jgi:hypothetical protein